MHSPIFEGAVKEGLNETMEGMRTLNAKIGVFLHPSRAADVQQGVHEILNSLLLRFNEEFGGVILAYLAPKIIGRTAKILSGLSPYFHVNLTSQLLVFSPAPGMLIEGKVNKVEKDYIGVVVFGLFNAVIGVGDIREDLFYGATDAGRHVWASEADNRHTIELGSSVRFHVKSLQETEHIIDISGSLAEDMTGSINWIESTSKRGSSKRSKEHNERKQKKSKKLKSK